MRLGVSNRMGNTHEYLERQLVGLRTCFSSQIHYSSLQIEASTNFSNNWPELASDPFSSWHGRNRFWCLLWPHTKHWGFQTTASAEESFAETVLQEAELLFRYLDVMGGIPAPLTQRSAFVESVLPVADSGEGEADEGVLAEPAPPPLLHVALSPSRKAFQNKAVNLVKQNLRNSNLRNAGLLFTFNCFLLRFFFSFFCKDQIFTPVIGTVISN